jgi:CheY-like chemotaxis protein
MLAVTHHPGVLLVADDDEDTRALFRTLLTARGHRVVEARDGAECLEAARTARPDLLMLDLRMPGLDGFEVMNRLRSDPSTAALPVLAITAMAEATIQERALKAGCAGILVKPVSPREVMTLVERLLVRARPESVA